MICLIVLDKLPWSLFGVVTSIAIGLGIALLVQYRNHHGHRPGNNHQYDDAEHNTEQFNYDTISPYAMSLETPGSYLDNMNLQSDGTSIPARTQGAIPVTGVNPGTSRNIDGTANIGDVSLRNDVVSHADIDYEDPMASQYTYVPDNAYTHLQGEVCSNSKKYDSVYASQKWCICIRIYKSALDCMCILSFYLL